MSRRHGMSKSFSKKLFKRAGSRTHWKNVAGGPMRGGIRL